MMRMLLLRQCLRLAQVDGYWLADCGLWAAHASLPLCRVSAEIDFNGSKLLERYMGRQDVSTMKARFKLAASSQDDAEFASIMKAYGTEVVSLVGAEVRAPRACHMTHVCCSI
jgi:hypothetical protein